jgi:ribonuclease HIII
MKNILDIISFEILTSRGNPPGYNRKFIKNELLNKIKINLHTKIYRRLLISVSEQVEPMLFDVKTSVKI